MSDSQVIILCLAVTVPAVCKAIVHFYAIKKGRRITVPTPWGSGEIEGQAHYPRRKKEDQRTPDDGGGR